jgi:hypothetical protein
MKTVVRTGVYTNGWANDEVSIQIPHKPPIPPLFRNVVLGSSHLLSGGACDSEEVLICK